MWYVVLNVRGLQYLFRFITADERMLNSYAATHIYMPLSIRCGHAIIDLHHNSFYLCTKRWKYTVLQVLLATYCCLIYAIYSFSLTLKYNQPNWLLPLPCFRVKDISESIISLISKIISLTALRWCVELWKYYFYTSIAYYSNSKVTLK